MLNEFEEFRAYTQVPNYTAASKRDTTYLGRFTFQTLTEFDGMGRILTVIARGYLFANGNDPYTQIDYAKNALCAWCSLPDKTKKAPENGARVDFSDLASEFPELVDEKGRGWFYRHVKNIINFVRSHPELVSKSAVNAAEVLAKSFTVRWKKKVKQMQVPIFAANTKGAWTLRFDDVLADAIEQGPLRNGDFDLPQEAVELLFEKSPKGSLEDLLPMLVKYYIAHLQDGEEWVVLPTSAIDAYYGNNSFSKKWKTNLDLFRFQNSYGICKFTISEQSLTDLRERGKIVI